MQLFPRCTLWTASTSVMKSSTPALAPTTDGFITDCKFIKIDDANKITYSFLFTIYQQGSKQPLPRH